MGQQATETRFSWVTPKLRGLELEARVQPLKHGDTGYSGQALTTGQGVILLLKIHPLKRFRAQPLCLRVITGHQLPWTCQTLFKLSDTAGLLPRAPRLVTFSGEKRFPPLVLNLFSTTGKPQTL